MCKGTLARLAERYAELSTAETEAIDLSTLDAWHERMNVASLANAPATFRAALRGWEQAGLEAMKHVQAKGDVA